MRPRTEIRSASRSNGAVDVVFSDGNAVTVDRIILATGYKPSLARLPFLAEGGLLDEIATRNASPVLDDAMQASVPGLYFTSMLATDAFGPFFAFTVSARAAAQLVARGIESGAA
jgi:pyruvate/2-oxoglutarate dehydrogenase complex dihydrolipoamide dehydrogenase (E3) component